MRRPPFDGKGLPSSAQVNEGLAKSARNHTRLDSRNNTYGSNRGSGPEQHGRSNPAELAEDAKEAFAGRVARRDDVLQVTSVLSSNHASYMQKHGVDK